MYLQQILEKYKSKNGNQINQSLLKQLCDSLIQWAGGCYLNMEWSGSEAKGTAISNASDLDIFISLSSNCNNNNGGLKSIFESLGDHLKKNYPVDFRKQNISYRITLDGYHIDITAGRKQLGNTNDYSIYISKKDTWRQTNIKKHISDISTSGRTNEIKLLKIWRELNALEFPSIYLEYLVIEILKYQPKGLEYLGKNFQFILEQLGSDSSNALDWQIQDPANSKNILSDLVEDEDKENIKICAFQDARAKNWNEIIF